MEQQKKKLRTLDTTLPTKCDICHDKIPLYSPWYSVMIFGHFCDDPKLKSANKDYQALCPSCFQAYEKFIIQQETHENHRRHMRDVR